MNLNGEIILTSYTLGYESTTSSTLGEKLPSLRVYANTDDGVFLHRI